MSARGQGEAGKHQRHREREHTGTGHGVSAPERRAAAERHEHQGETAERRGGTQESVPTLTQDSGNLQPSASHAAELGARG